jgi:hypothetical protein
MDTNLNGIQIDEKNQFDALSEDLVQIQYLISSSLGSATTNYGLFDSVIGSNT